MCALEALFAGYFYREKFQDLSILRRVAGRQVLVRNSVDELVEGGAGALRVDSTAV